MKAEVQKYAWLTDVVGVNACVSVVVQADPERVAEAFGCDPLAETVPEGEASWDSELSLAVNGGDVLVIEDNGFEGSREEVMRVASRASEVGLAASIYWNENVG